MKYILLFVVAVSCAFAQPRVLVVNAHPDDESGCAATIYKITHDLHGIVDLCLITNGEAGFKYSTLAESWYGLELTDEKVGRTHLPRIRKQEMMNAGKIIGLRNIFFLEHQDQRFTLDVNEVFTQAWVPATIKAQIAEILRKGNYDYVFCLLPTPDTHGGHKGASILALQAVSEMKGKRPVILGVGLQRKDSVAKPPATLDSLPITKLKPNVAPFTFDRSTKFGFNDRLNYKIITNWLVAEHKSQGTVQLGMNEIDLETFWYFDINSADDIERTRTFFADIAVVPFKKKTY